MIISHKYRFIFIKTIKTAGTSIEVYLSAHCGPDDVLTPLHPAVEGHEPRNYGHFYNHYSAWGLRRDLPADIWDRYFKFCVERNPWDKTLSDFHMARARHPGNPSFDDYLRRGRFCSSWELYTDQDNASFLVDEVLRYESLDEELGRVFSRLEVPFEGRLGVRAKSAYRQDRRPYREVYSERQRTLVATAFAREIEQFGYEF
jgi:hypothetical protein